MTAPPEPSRASEPDGGHGARGGARPGDRPDGRRGAFDALSPDLVLEAVNLAWGIEPEGALEPFSSYVNRVYGIRAADGARYVAKFYRPGRWSRLAIEDEHRFVADCARADIPVAEPLPLPPPHPDGGTIAEIEIEDSSLPDASAAFMFALYPRKAGRSFDAERDEDWLRIGALAGRIHAAGRGAAAPARLILDSALTRAHVATLTPIVHPDLREEFDTICDSAIPLVSNAIDALPRQRIHGDLHRGNILDRGSEGLTVLDFDDMATGPVAQDLWMLLPGSADECGREWSLIAEGYSEFSDLPSGSRGAVEALRFHRMLHFLAWQYAQRNDARFERDNPGWGGRAFWIREVEDLRDQAARLSR